MVCEASSSSKVRSAVRLASLYPANVAEGFHDFISSGRTFTDNRIVYLSNLYGTKVGHRPRWDVPVWACQSGSQQDFSWHHKVVNSFAVPPGIDTQVPDKYAMICCQLPLILWAQAEEYVRYMYDFRFNCSLLPPRVRSQLRELE